MSKKSEARALRKAAETERFEAAKTRILANMDISPLPKVQGDLTMEEKITPHIGISPAQLKIPEQPVAKESGTRFNLAMTWCARKQDVEGTWGWGEKRAWSDSEFNEIIEPNLRNLSGLLWNEIENQASGSGHLMHHSHNIGDLAQEAQARWSELLLEQFDTVFRFRQGGTRRAWGFVIKAHFFLVWWERHHQIYKIK